MKLSQVYAHRFVTGLTGHGHTNHLFKVFFFYFQQPKLKLQFWFSLDELRTWEADDSYNQ